MEISQLSLTALLLMGATAAIAQTPTKGIEFGIKGGATFTHGFTNIPAQTVGTLAIEVPAFKNKSNGIGLGYSGGLWARKNINMFSIQAEVTYNRFVLKQKTDVTVDVNANAAIANALPVSVLPGLLTASLNVTSESVLETVNVPILFGKRFMDGRLRAYAGPSVIFIRKAEANRISAGQLNANPAIGFPETPIPASSGTTNLLNKFEARNLEVNDITYGLELGSGFSPINRLAVDVRYTLPVGGLYNDRKITGFLGFATVSLVYKIF